VRHDVRVRHAHATRGSGRAGRVLQECDVAPSSRAPRDARIHRELLDDETPLFDSRVIVEYIDNVTPNSKLFPAPNRERTEVKRWEALADGICDAAANAFLEGKRPAEQKSADWIQRQRDKVTRGLEFMAGELGEKSFCMGTHFSMADIAVGTALGYLNFRFADIEWQESYPNLGKLYAKLMLRQSFIDTVPKD